MSEPRRCVIELPSTVWSHQRVMLKITSSALNGSPLFQLAPLRTCRTYSVAWSLTSQLSTSRPSNVPSRVNLTSGSSDWRIALAISDQSAVRGSLFALTNIETLSTPPVFGSAAIARLGAAMPIMPYAMAVDAPKTLASARNSRRSMPPPFTSSAMASM